MIIIIIILLCNFACFETGNVSVLLSLLSLKFSIVEVHKHNYHFLLSQFLSVITLLVNLHWTYIDTTTAIVSLCEKYVFKMVY